MGRRKGMNGVCWCEELLWGSFLDRGLVGDGVETSFFH